MVRLLHYANEFNIEGLIATADNNYAHEEAVIRDDLIHKLIDDYELTLPNLKIHNDGFPPADQLRNVVKKGNNKGGTSVSVDDFIGEGFDTEGSDWIIKMVDTKSEQPVCVAVWGGACDLAQALWKVKNTRTKIEQTEFVEKLKVYFIGKQDASNDWIIENFADLWLILALDLGGDKWQSGYRGMFWGGDMSTTSKEWIHKNIHGHSKLADNYPDQAHTGGASKNPHNALKEGDTPSFLYFLQTGLNHPEHPEWGSFGGRFYEERPGFFRDASDSAYDQQSGKIISSPRATVFRWRTSFQNDFAARVDWGASPDFNSANHAPIINVLGSEKNEPMEISAKAGSVLKMDASKTYDPDMDELTFQWSEYVEPGNGTERIKIESGNNSNLSIRIPENSAGTTAHLVLKVSDNGSPTLCSYKRIVVNIH